VRFFRPDDVFLGRGRDLRRARWPRRRRELRLSDGERSLLGAQRMVGLRRVELTRMTAPQLGFLTNLRHLTELRLIDCVRLDPRPLERMTRLRTLVVRTDDPESIRALAQLDLSAMTQLTTLDLPDEARPTSPAAYVDPTDIAALARHEPPHRGDPDEVLFDSVSRPDLGRLPRRLRSLEIIDCEGPIDLSPIRRLTHLERLVVFAYDDTTMKDLADLDLRHHDQLRVVALQSIGDPGRLAEIRVDWMAKLPFGAAVSVEGYTIADDALDDLRPADKVVATLRVTVTDGEQEGRIRSVLHTTHLEPRAARVGARIEPHDPDVPDGPLRLTCVIDRWLGIWPDRHVDASGEIEARLTERAPALAALVAFRPSPEALEVDAWQREHLEAVVVFLRTLDAMPHLRVPLSVSSGALDR
jgi:hypothetical protein